MSAKTALIHHCYPQHLDMSTEKFRTVFNLCVLSDTFVVSLQNKYLKRFADFAKCIYFVFDLLSHAVVLWIALYSNHTQTTTKLRPILLKIRECSKYINLLSSLFWPVLVCRFILFVTSTNDDVISFFDVM